MNYDCLFFSQETEVTNRLKTHVRMNGIFYSMNESLHHYLKDNACNGHVTISCYMGVKHFSVYNKIFNTCPGIIY